MSTADALQERLDKSRERLLEAIEMLPDEALLTAGAVGKLSVAALLAEITAWEAELVTGFMRLDQGKKPDRLLAALNNPVSYSQKRQAEANGRDLDSIFDDFQQVRMQLETWLEEFSDKDLSSKKRFKWFKGKSLADVIGQATFEREEKIIPKLQAFAQSWQDDDSGEQDLGQSDFWILEPRN